MRFVRCINNRGFIYDQNGQLFDETIADLQIGQVYKVIPSADHVDEFLRIIDDSGEDYLYPASYFEHYASVEVATDEGNTARGMKHPEKLLNRLNEIGQSLEKTGKALALIGVGSVGLELDRLDAYSDLDFFAIVEPGQKERFLINLDWLSSLAPIAYHFQNTVDGYKLLFANGVFCEFAIFEEAELSHIPFAAGRIVWKREGVSDAIAVPVKQSSPPAHSVEWLVGEALTNLYVGLGRYRRGEKLSAFYFVQVYALGRVVDLAERIEAPQSAYADPFAGERRFEQRFPGVAGLLAQMAPGYEGTPAAALAILHILDQHFSVNPFIKEAILRLCAMELVEHSP